MSLDAVYEGEPDRKCKTSGRRTSGMESGQLGTIGSWIQCSKCGARLPHQSGYNASRFPPHNVPRILTKRPRWAKNEEG